MSDYVDLTFRISKEGFADLVRILFETPELADLLRVIIQNTDYHPQDESLPETPTDPNNSVPTTPPESNPLPIPETEIIPSLSHPSPSPAPHPPRDPIPMLHIPAQAGQIRPSGVFRARYRINTRKRASTIASRVSRINPGDWILVHISTQIIRDGYRWVRAAGQREEWFAIGKPGDLWGELHSFTDGRFIARTLSPPI